MARHASLRASDADRERVVDHLRSAAAEGRLAAHELEQRVGTALGARTYGELDATVADLPLRRTRPRSPLASARAHPLLLVAAIPVVIAVVAFVTAITLASVALAAVLFVLGRRRVMYLGPGMCALRRGLGPPARLERGASGQWGHWA